MVVRRNRYDGAKRIAVYLAAMTTNLPSCLVLTLMLAAPLVGCGMPAAGEPEHAGYGDATRPTVIELYQSQGCSSCPPALAVLDQIASERRDVIALNFAVTYWDQLGWKDQFAQPAFTARQWDFARAQGRGNVQTPQLIVNGTRAVLGSRKAEVEAAIASASRKGTEPIIRITGGKLAIGKGAAAKATVWLVDYDPRGVAVPISAGENSGRTLVHRNIVHRLTALGGWTGAPSTYSLPPIGPGLVRAALVQVGKGGPIVGAARL